MHASHQRLVHDVNDMMLDSDHAFALQLAQYGRHGLTRGADHVGNFLVRERNVQTQPLCVRNAAARSDAITFSARVCAHRR